MGAWVEVGECAGEADAAGWVEAAGEWEAAAEPMPVKVVAEVEVGLAEAAEVDSEAVAGAAWVEVEAWAAGAECPR